jgi:hypothetical protein
MSDPVVQDVPSGDKIPTSKPLPQERINEQDETTLDENISTAYNSIASKFQTTTTQIDDDDVPVVPSNNVSGDKSRNRYRNENKDRQAGPIPLTNDEIAQAEAIKLTNYPNLPLDETPFDSDAHPDSCLIKIDELPIPLIYKHLFNVCLTVSPPDEIYITNNRLSAFIQLNNRADAVKLGRFFHNYVLVGGFPKQGQLTTPIPSRLISRITNRDELNNIRLASTSERPGWVVVENGALVLKKNDDWSRDDTSGKFTTKPRGSRLADNDTDGKKNIITKRHRLEQDSINGDAGHRNRVQQATNNFNHTVQNPPIFWQTAQHVQQNPSPYYNFEQNPGLQGYYQQYNTYPPAPVAPPSSQPPVTTPLPPPHAAPYYPPHPSQSYQGYPPQQYQHGGDYYQQSSSYPPYPQRQPQHGHGYHDGYPPSHAPTQHGGYHHHSQPHYAGYPSGQTQPAYYQDRGHGKYNRPSPHGDREHGVGHQGQQSQPPQRGGDKREPYQGGYNGNKSGRKFDNERGNGGSGGYQGNSNANGGNKNRGGNGGSGGQANAGSDDNQHGRERDRSYGSK